MMIGKILWVGRSPLLTIWFPWFWLKIGWVNRMLFSERNGYRTLVKLGPIFASIGRREKR